MGIEDPIRGQLVAAAVVPKPGAELDPEELRAHVRTQLSTYKAPAHIVLMDEDEVPWTASHKVRGGLLAQMIAARVGLEPPGA